MALIVAFQSLALLEPTGAVAPGTASLEVAVSAERALVGEPVTFEAVVGAAGVWSFEWRFSDGARASGRQVSHAFDNTGQAAAVVSATNTAGEVAVAARPVVIVNVERVQGDDRIGTALAATGWPEVPARRYGSILLVRADDPSDAVAASTLGGASFLLTPSDRLDPRVAAFITEAGGDVVMVGGSRALSPSVEQQLHDTEGVVVRRIEGSDRYATAAQVAHQFAGGYDGANLEGTDYLVRADPSAHWYESLAAAQLSRFDGRALLFLDGDDPSARLPDSLATSESERLTLVSSTGSAMPDLQMPLDAPPVVGRFVLPDAPDEAFVAILGHEPLLWWQARVPTDPGVDQQVVVASMQSWPDAVVGLRLADARRAVLLLTDPDDLLGSPATDAWLDDHRTNIANVTVVGGPAAVSPHVEEQIARHLVQSNPEAPCPDTFRSGQETPEVFSAGLVCFTADAAPVEGGQELDIRWTATNHSTAGVTLDYDHGSCGQVQTATSGRFVAGGAWEPKRPSIVPPVICIDDPICTPDGECVAAYPRESFDLGPGETFTTRAATRPDSPWYAVSSDGCTPLAPGLYVFEIDIQLAGGIVTVPAAQRVAGASTGPC